MSQEAPNEERRLTLRLPAFLYEWLIERSEHEDRSLNEQIVHVLRARWREEQKADSVR